MIPYHRPCIQGIRCYRFLESILSPTLQAPPCEKFRFHKFVRLSFFCEENNNNNNNSFQFSSRGILKFLYRREKKLFPSRRSFIFLWRNSFNFSSLLFSFLFSLLLSKIELFQGLFVYNTGTQRRGGIKLSKIYSLSSSVPRLDKIYPLTRVFFLREIRPISRNNELSPRVISNNSL